MAKKYLSLDEAAEYLGISVEALKTARENHEIRGFADRATFKFRVEDLDEFKRTLSADSSPDVPIFNDPEDGSSILRDDDDSSIGDQPTIINTGSILDDDDDGILGPSDSDVRLVLDEDFATEAADSSTSGAGIQLSDSDSDVRLFEDSDIQSGSGSDSDVRLVTTGEGSVGDSDSDVRMVDSGDLGGSDSDVRLVTDSEPLLAGSDSDVNLVPDDSGVKLIDSGVNIDDSAESVSILDEDEPFDFNDDGHTIAAGSGILQSPADSGISLEADSNISFKDDDDDVQILGADSSPAIGGDDSGIALETDDSGIGLQDFADSGIALDLDDDDDAFAIGADSGISLDSPTDSGIALEALMDSGEGADLDRTMEMDSFDGEDDLDATQAEIPLLMDDDDDFQLSGTDIEIPVAANDDTETGVIVFDDDEEVSDHSPTMMSGGDEFDLGGDDDFGDYDEFTAEDDLEVAPDIMGEDDELDVFDAEDDDFDDAFQAGTSHAGFVAEPQGVAYAAPEAEWGVGTFIGILLSTAVMGICAMVMFDLVKTMWSWEQPIGFNSPILEQVRGLFSS